MFKATVKARSKAILVAILMATLNAILKARRAVLEIHGIFGFGETRGLGKKKPSGVFFFPSPLSAQPGGTNREH